MTDLTLMEPAYVRCRTFGHAWYDVDPSSEEQISKDLAKYNTLIAAACVRCDMRRHDLVVSRSGELVNRRYVYPVGYILAKGVKRPKRDEFRLQLLANRLSSLRKGGNK